jgi:hypothetical protein
MEVGFEVEGGATEEGEGSIAWGRPIVCG